MCMCVSLTKTGDGVIFFRSSFEWLQIAAGHPTLLLAFHNKPPACRGRERRGGEGGGEGRGGEGWDAHSFLIS